MKFFKKTTLLVTTLAATSFGLAGCKSNVKLPVTFVAATSNTYNAEVTIGDYDYKFRGKVDQKSDNFTLEGLVQQRHLKSGSSGQQGGPGGGGGFPGMGGGGGGQEQAKPNPTSFSFNLEKTEVYINEEINANLQVQPMGADTSATWTSSDEKVLTVKDGTITPVGVGSATVTATSTKDPTVTATSAAITVSQEDLEAHNWLLTGKWTMDEGYGYVITLDDERKTEVHVDFDKVQGRHQFYYTVEIENNKSTILFQAKDPTFKDSLAKDYKTWDERDSKYIYYAKATGNNGSAATAYLYLHNDGSGVLNVPSGTNRAYTFGLTWEEDANKVVTLHNGELAYASKNSVNADHPGSLLSYGSYTFLRSDNPAVKWKKLTLSDFEGATTHEFAGTYTVQGPDGGTKEVALNLYANGAAKLYNGSWTATEEGEWSEADGVITLTLGGKPYPVTKEGDKAYVTYKIESQSIFGKQTIEVQLWQTK